MTLSHVPMYFWERSPFTVFAPSMSASGNGVMDDEENLAACIRELIYPIGTRVWYGRVGATIVGYMQMGHTCYGQPNGWTYTLDVDGYEVGAGVSIWPPLDRIE